MDMGTLGGPPEGAHWGVVYRIDDSYVHLANAKNLTMVPEACFLRAFECWFMLPRFHHCAVFARPKTVGSPEAVPVYTARDGPADHPTRSLYVETGQNGRV